MKDYGSLERELVQSGKREALEKLASSDGGRRLEGLIDGAALERAMKSGDAAALRSLFASLMASPEGRRLAGDVEKIMRK